MGCKCDAEPRTAPRAYTYLPWHWEQSERSTAAAFGGRWRTLAHGGSPSRSPTWSGVVCSAISVHLSPRYAPETSAAADDEALRTRLLTACRLTHGSGSASGLGAGGRGCCRGSSSC